MAEEFSRIETADGFETEAVVRRQGGRGDRCRAFGGGVYHAEMHTSALEGVEVAASVELLEVGSANPRLPDDALFGEIERLRMSTSREATLRLRALLVEATQQRLPWHQAYAGAGLAMTLHVHDPDAALLQARAALAQMQALRTREGQLLAWTAIGLAQRGRGEMVESVAALERALELARELGSPIRQAQALSNLSLALEHVGQREAGLAFLEEALTLAPPDHHRLRSTIRNNMANALATVARYARDDGEPRAQWQHQAERAVGLARELVAHPEERRREYLQNPHYPRGCLAKALVVLDELDEALPLLEDLQTVYTAAGDHYALLFVQLELARGRLQAGQPAEARAVAQQAIELARRCGVEQLLPDLWLALSQACQAMADWQPAFEAFQAFHALKLHAAMQAAEDRARTLAVRLDTARAMRESRLDPLTGLLNRRGFDETLAAGLETATGVEPLSLLLIDVDFLKAVNDRDGHVRGDEALAMVGQQLKTACRAQDQAARLGGDEFAWFGKLSSEQAFKVAQRTQQRLRAASAERWPDRAPLTLSIGIAEANEACPAQSLLRRADAALYAAKVAGRDRIHHA